MNFSNNVAWKGDDPTETITGSYQKGFIKPGNKLLDIGSGFGRNSNWLASQGVLVTAININPAEIFESQTKAQKLGVTVNYLKANAINLPFSDNYFDVALDCGCTHLLPNLSSQKIAESEVARVLKSGAYLIYFGFSKQHPAYIPSSTNPMFRNLSDIHSIYEKDFEILSSQENRWPVKPEENSKHSEHVGLEIIMRKK